MSVTQHVALCFQNTDDFDSPRIKVFCTRHMTKVALSFVRQYTSTIYILLATNQCYVIARQSCIPNF